VVDRDETYDALRALLALAPQRFQCLGCRREAVLVVAEYVVVAITQEGLVRVRCTYCGRPQELQVFPTV
jgi:transcription elongation factor Elf1